MDVLDAFIDADHAVTAARLAAQVTVLRELEAFMAPASLVMTDASDVNSFLVSDRPAAGTPTRSGRSAR
ncbi:MAG TPA: hypothetical protein VN213_10135 [Solirubrobacteraceae bacterium]|nr:hypothetical protein [Solirubrobacteraceae bacterium]